MPLPTEGKQAGTLPKPNPHPDRRPKPGQGYSRRVTHLPCISRASPVHLPCISRASPRQGYSEEAWQEVGYFTRVCDFYDNTQARARVRVRGRGRVRVRVRVSPIPHPNPNPTAGQAQLRSWEAEEAEEDARAPLGWEPTALLDAPIEAPPHAVRRSISTSREATPKEAPKQGPSGLTSGRTSGRSPASAPRKRLLES